jgi:ABC-type transport system involved in cytochrome bd biosynthesis fused ATPase/permease subunit
MTRKFKIVADVMFYVGAAILALRLITPISWPITQAACVTMVAGIVINLAILIVGKKSNDASK